MIENLYNSLLYLYPEKYRAQYSHEMRLVFREMYQEQLKSRGKVGLEFWFLQIIDIVKSVIGEHLTLIEKAGIKKYSQQTLHINKYNVIGFLFLVPFFLMFATDLVSRIAQRDLTHYNRPVYHYLSQTPLYWTPVLYTIVIVFPLMAIALNVIPILHQKRKRVVDWNFVRKNFIALIIILTGLGCISIIKLHDFLPCMIHGLLNGRLTQFSQLFPYCQKS